MAKRENFFSGSRYEKAYGYSRAVKVGDTIYISGTVGNDPTTGTFAPDAASQTRQAIQNILPALESAGAKLQDIVQMVTYISAPEVFDEIGPVLGEIFGEISPTNAMLVVQFPVAGAKVEISATAIIGSSD